MVYRISFVGGNFLPRHLCRLKHKKPKNFSPKPRFFQPRKLPKLVETAITENNYERTMDQELYC